MVRFSASPKNEPHSPALREQSERKAKKLLLGLCPPLNYLVRARFARRKEREVVHFSG
ncbi:MAG: hypothetical protein U5L45_08915 [Saprospiraceae bacterium]|nr:hypothetical protein [Saprospiraceae bacterium]